MNDLRSSFTLRQLLGGLYLIGMVSLTASVIVFLQQRLTDYFHQALVENGRTIAQRLAEDGRLSIIQGTSEPIRPRLETVMNYPNVTGIVLATAQGKILSALGPQATPPHSVSATDPSTGPILKVEDADSLTIITPVFDQIAASGIDPFSGPFRAEAPVSSPQSPNILGFASLTLSKTQLQHDIRELQDQIAVVMGVGISIFTIGMLLLLRQITRPIQQLARTMSDPETVQHFRRVEVRGVHEARSIATAFNALIARVATMHHELLAHQADLAQRVEEAVREMKAQNAKLTQAREQAEAASRVKSEFMANMSHEIRTPLHGLLGALSLLEKTPLSDKQKSHLVMMREDADRLLREINSILDFSQLEAHGLQLRERPCHLKSWLERATKPFAARAQAKKLRLTLTLDPHLPEWVQADGGQLEKILCNLMDNAIKFTAQGEIRIRAWSQPASAGTLDIHFSVEDTGVGIPPEQQAKIFEPFTQVDSSTTRKYSGNGLGLAISRQLVELMKGRITLKSQPGTGSTFQVELPLTLSEPAAEWVNESEHAPSDVLQRFVSPRDEAVSERRLGKSFRHAGRRVLVVDDERQSRLYAQFVLLELNAEVMTAANGAEALDACEQQRFDLILMDVRMPNMDGLETTRRLRQQRTRFNAHTPIVGLTADVLNLDRQDWQAAGMDACYHKPLESDALTEIFTRWGIRSPAKAFSLSAFLRKYHEY